VHVESQAPRHEEVRLDPVAALPPVGVDDVVELDLDLVVVVDAEPAVDQLLWVRE
jgi:hypothetical protein